jgi:hypothetical protein
MGKDIVRINSLVQFDMDEIGQNLNEIYRRKMTSAVFIVIGYLAQVSDALIVSNIKTGEIVCDFHYRYFKEVSIKDIHIYR